MATLIPSINTCLRNMTSGERRFAECLQNKLEDDYYCWYDVPVGPQNLHPDFIILHPQRGIVILEIKDWKPETILSITRHDTSILTPNGPVTVKNPLEQAREYAEVVADILKTDSQLISIKNGKLLFPWTYGVVFTNITRTRFDQGCLADVFPEHRVICKDEMAKTVDTLQFQERLWEMFTFGNNFPLSLPQIERIRWHLFPEIRLPYRQGSLFEAIEEQVQTPTDILSVMDIQQEQLARSLGEGHRVVHGVAGSGKTVILGYRAQHLAQTCSRPILVLCYNKVLARRLDAWMKTKGVADKVRIHNFHAWCHKQLVAYNAGLPDEKLHDEAFANELVQRVIRQVDRKIIPTGQYDAILIDEGHDFKPEWFKLVVQMVNPLSNSLLIMYDDAQSIYDTHKRKGFSFKSAGIQAQGRTTILKLNYRNTQEILDCASLFAKQIISGVEADDDGVPVVSPVSAGRHGPRPIEIKLPTLHDEAAFITKSLQQAQRDGIPWRDMAVLYRHWEPTGTALNTALREAHIPYIGKGKIGFDKSEDRVALLPYHSSKGLEFPLIAIPAGDLPEKANETEARLLYVAMTRATSRLIVTTTSWVN